MEPVGDFIYCVCTHLVYYKEMACLMVGCTLVGKRGSVSKLELKVWLKLLPSGGFLGESHSPAFKAFRL